MLSAFYTKKPLKNLKYCIQRIRRGYCDGDLYELDVWFVSVIVPMLRQLNKTREGYPDILRKEYIEKQIKDTDIEYDDYLCNHLEEVDEACNKEWSNILNQIADNFEKLEDIEFKFRRKHYEEREKLKKETFRMFAKWFNYLWE